MIKIYLFKLIKNGFSFLMMDNIMILYDFYTICSKIVVGY